ncbi:FAD-dependent oxidoreductase [Streptomyces sp. NPDC093544]|jgi:2-polyprenyl-6-methoxyphenol hydroxylase-like FAD-dependent oxidoreductase|uniref:FAD-dependent oxidoreductase n=1 Tax=Streptomyces sp. NPDC093544 TaxID=3155200 RepID=UPI00342BE77B
MDADVLVVGAGIAGLTTAARLLRLGVRVTVIERAAEIQAAGAGIMLHPNALAHLDHLGPELHATGTEIARQVTTDPDGSATSLDWAAVWGEGRLPLAVQRLRLAELMVHHLPEGTVRWSTEPVALHQHGDHVEVDFADGRSGRYGLVIGADGVNSWVRRQYVDPDAEPAYLGHVYWRTTVPSTAPFDFTDWRIWRAGGNFFGGMPIGGARHHIFLQAALDRPVKVAPEDAYPRLMALAAEMGPQVASLAGQLDPADSYAVRPALGLGVRRWVNGRIALLGDAAHSFSPATTQGGAMAIEDSAVLAEEITRSGVAPRALADYEARRTPRIRDFTRLARLHGVLSSTVQHGLALGPDPASGPAHAPRTAPSPTAWFRRLYRPLLEAA